MTDTTLKTLILDVLTNNTYDATNPEIQSALAVHQNVTVQCRRISRLCEGRVA